MKPILLVDDDIELCQMLAEYLQLEGFEVAQAHDGQQALNLAGSCRYAVIILDVMMPGLNGFDTLRALRQRPDSSATTPVLMMSARGEEVDRIVGLEIGADDYLPKPCSPRELLARIRAITRRVALEHQHSAVTANKPQSTSRLVIDNQHATLAGKELELTQTELRILQQLQQATGQLVNKAALNKAALNRLPGPFDRSLDMHLSNLRKKISRIAPEMIQIQTVRGLGYRLIETANSNDQQQEAGDA